MSRQRNSVIPTLTFIACLLLAACSPATGAAGTPKPAPTITTPALARASPTPGATAIPTRDATPGHFSAHTLFRGGARPDDLIFDEQGHLLFSDFYSGMI